MRGSAVGDLGNEPGSAVARRPPGSSTSFAQVAYSSSHASCVCASAGIERGEVLRLSDDEGVLRRRLSLAALVEDDAEQRQHDDREHGDGPDLDRRAEDLARALRARRPLLIHALSGTRASAQASAGTRVVAAQAARDLPARTDAPRRRCRAQARSRHLADTWPSRMSRPRPRGEAGSRSRSRAQRESRRHGERREHRELVTADACHVVADALERDQPVGQATQGVVAALPCR